MTGATHARLLAVAGRLESGATGMEVWRVATPDGAFCMQFTHVDTLNPEHACRQWIREHAEYAAARQYTAQKVHVHSAAEALMRAAAAELRLIAIWDGLGLDPSPPGAHA